MPGECPDGTFECGGNCADLLTDPNNCGSCGKACADEWPQEWTDAGFTFEGANIEPICAQAECTFMCAESETGPQELIEDTQNCGACGNVCASDAVNSLDDACVGARCFCVLTDDGERGLLGNTCNDRCTLGGLNCQEGCCPNVRNGNNPIPARGNQDGNLAYQFVVERPEGVLLTPPEDCDSVGFQLIGYTDDGFIQALSNLSGCRSVRAPLLAPGLYTIIVRPERNEESSFTLTRLPIEPDFDAPGEFDREAISNNSYATFRIPEAGEWDIYFDESESGGSCDDEGSVVLLNSAGEIVQTISETNNCVFELDGRWRGMLEPGVYMALGQARRLSGSYRVVVRRIEEEPEPEPQEFPMVIPFDGFGQNGSDTIPLRFNEAGRYSLTTTGAGGNGCPGDTILTLRGPGGQLASDDDGGPSNCSRINYDFDANTDYSAVVTGYRNRAIGAGALVVDRL
jgi:hypothetical protein